MPAIPQIVQTTSGRLAMLAPSAPLTVLVSGGGDSVALLRLLAEGLLGRRSLRALHVNHMLRGAEAEADEEFVRGLCGHLGVGYIVVAYDVASYAREEGLNLEDAGRCIRYRFAEEELDAFCDELGVPREQGRIATGHSLDDRVETFFMRAFTGSGPGALSSIAPVRGRVVRPLIDCTREEIRAWLREIGQDWRDDVTNAQTDRLRTLIRHEIVPVAERVNPRFRETLARTLDLLAGDDALLSEMAEAFARDFAIIDAGKGEVAFDRAFVSTLSRPMARRTVREALHEAFPETSRLDFSHVDALADGLADDSFARDLPEGLRAFTEYGRTVVVRSSTEQSHITPGLLPMPGTVDLGSAGTITAAECPAGDTTGTADSVVIDAGLVGDEPRALVVDGVRPGDRMRPLGMEGTRKLSDMLVDAKVPRRKRMAVPVVRDGERIVWLAGVRLSDDYRVTADTTYAVRLAWARPDDTR